MSLRQVDKEERDILTKWRVDSRAMIVNTVAELRQINPRRRSRSEQLRQLREGVLGGLGVFGIGIACFALPPEIPLIGGDVRGWLGLSFVIAGLLICALAVFNIFSARLRIKL
jgi:hypothetical protein